MRHTAIDRGAWPASCKAESELKLFKKLPCFSAKTSQKNDPGNRGQEIGFVQTPGKAVLSPGQSEPFLQTKNVPVLEARISVRSLESKFLPNRFNSVAHSPSHPIH